MGLKASASVIFLVSMNLVFFTLVTSQTPTCPQDLGVCESDLTRAFFGAAPNPNSECCRRFAGLTDAQTGACICQILRANRSRIPVSLNTVGRVFLTFCARDPSIFNCT